jgi:phage repressor protein C with HTH and peptisase S24 domain
MKEPHERLQAARAAAGYQEASEAARALGIKEPTYLGHENGSRGFKSRADQYARKYGVSLEWLLTGRGQKERRSERLEDNKSRRTIPLVGYVGAGAEAHFLEAGELGRVEAPDGSTDTTVAVEIRGDSLGPLFDRWLVAYDDVRRPVTADLVGRLCVVGLDDGRVMVKKIRRSKSRGLFHLISNTEAPILDVAIEWAARVKNMVPR